MRQALHDNRRSFRRSFRRPFRRSFRRTSLVREAESEPEPESTSALRASNRGCTLRENLAGRDMALRGTVPGLFTPGRLTQSTFFRCVQSMSGTIAGLVDMTKGRGAHVATNGVPAPAPIARASPAAGTGTAVGDRAGNRGLRTRTILAQVRLVHPKAGPPESRNPGPAQNPGMARVVLATTMGRALDNLAPIWTDNPKSVSMSQVEERPSTRVNTSQYGSTRVSHRGEGWQTPRKSTALDK